MSLSAALRQKFSTEMGTLLDEGRVVRAHGGCLVTGETTEIKENLRGSPMKND